MESFSYAWRTESGHRSPLLVTRRPETEGADRVSVPEEGDGERGSWALREGGSTSWCRTPQSRPGGRGISWKELSDVPGGTGISIVFPVAPFPFNSKGKSKEGVEQLKLILPVPIQGKKKRGPPSLCRMSWGQLYSSCSGTGPSPEPCHVTSPDVPCVGEGGGSTDR